MRVAAMFAAFTVFIVPATAAPKPEFPAVAHAAKICTASGAFGRHFGEVQYGHIDTTVDDIWAPFHKLTISAHQIRAVAEFQGKSTDAEFDRAHDFLKALDKAVKAHFAHRDGSGSAVVFHTSDKPDTGIVLDLHQEGDHVVADCVELGPDGE